MDHLDDFDEILDMDITDLFDPPPEQKHADEIGPLPKYMPNIVNRGDLVDTFFNKPLYKKMTDNAHVINTITYGSDDDVMTLSNFAAQTPGTKAKCDQALECKFFTDVTIYLTFKYSMSNIADVYRRMAMLSDRLCLGCESKSAKVVCLCGKWRCHNCINKGKDIEFSVGLQQWLDNGSPTRHAINCSAI